MATSTSNAIWSLLVLCFSAGAVGNVAGQETGQPDAASAQGSALAALREAVRALDQMKRADGQLPDKEVLRLWFEIAPLFFALGDRDSADRAFAKARDLTEEFAAMNDFGEYQFLGLAYAKVGNVDAVVKLAKAIQDSIPDHRGSGADLRRVILGDAAMAAGKAGRLADGLRIAKSIRNANYRSAIESTARREDIMRRARTGDFAGAKAAADKMRTDLGRVRMLVGNVVLNPLTGEDLTPSEWGIALIQMDLGDRDGARATIRQAQVLQEKIDKNARGGCAAAIARDLARIGDIDAALKEATNVVNPNTHLKVIAEIAMAQVLAGKEAAALETVAGLTADTERIFVLHQIGYAQAKAGNKAGAKESFRRAVELADKSESGLFYNVALAQAAAGDISGAVQTAENHDAPNELWSRIALRQLRFGDYSGARQTLAKHEWGGLGQPSAVLRMAEDQARDGHEKEAREWMAKETDPLVRAHAFVGLAKGLCPEDGSRTPAAATAK